MSDEPREPFITYDVEGEIMPEDVPEVVEVLKDFLKDPRCDGFDGVDADA